MIEASMAMEYLTRNDVRIFAHHTGRKGADTTEVHLTVAVVSEGGALWLRVEAGDGNSSMTRLGETEEAALRRALG